MSDYSEITSLSQLDPLTPAGTSPASDLDDAIRQVKQFLRTYLSKAHDDSGAIKAGAIPSNSLKPGSVRGGADNTDTVGRELAIGTVSANDLRDLAVVAAKLADNAVVTAKLNDSAVTTPKLAANAVDPTKLANNAVTTTKLADDAVTAAKLADSPSTDANRAVTSDHIRDNAVIEAKIASGAISEAKFKAAATSKVLVGTGSGAQFVPIGGAFVGTLVGGVLKLTLGGFSGGFSAAYALLKETSSSGSPGGTLTAAAWNVRGYTPCLNWNETLDAGDLVGLTGGGNIQFKKVGTYWIKAIAPSGATVGPHMLRWRKVSGTAVTVMSGISSVQGQPAHLTGLFEVAADLDEYQLQHFVTTTLASTGAGAPASTVSEQETYAIIEIISLGNVAP